MTWKMFYADYSENKILNSEDACTSTQDEILHSMDCVLHRPENFLGITDENNKTLQFMVNEDRSIHVDVPDPAKRGSYVKTSDLDECLELVRGLGESLDLEEIEGMEFQPW